MRRFLLFFLLILANFAYSQDSVINTNFRKFYIGAGLGVGSGKYGAATVTNANLNVDIIKNYFTSFRYYRFVTSDEPRHEIDDWSMQIGKSFSVCKNISLIISAGPSYIYYRKPINIRLSGGCWGLSFGSGYNYDMEPNKLAGLALRADSEFNVSRKLGLAVGVFGNINPEYSFGGMQFNLLLGRLKQNLN